MYKQTGSQTYATIGLESGVMSASPHQLITMLFDGAQSALIRAGLHMEAGKMALKGQDISRAINIIDNGLKAGVNKEKGGEIAQDLVALYDYMVRHLLHANLHNDAEELQHVTELLENIAGAWRQIGPQSQPTTQDAR